MATSVSTCDHVAYRVDVENREVRCTGCGGILDPYGVLKHLEDLASQLEGRMAAIAARETEQRRRQEWAIAQKQKKQLRVARAQCELCGGTGWAPGAARGLVVRCRCRRA